MVRSFGQPAPVVDLDEMQPPEGAAPAGGTVSVGRLRVEVDLVVTPESLASIEEQLAETITRAVSTGFARAAAAE